MRIDPNVRTAIRIGLAVMAILPAAAGTLAGQGQKLVAPEKKVMNRDEKAASDLKKAKERAKQSEALFASASPLEVTLRSNMKRIRGDKGDNTPWRPAVMSYMTPDGKKTDIPGEIKTRGIWRLKNCEFPPIRLNFKSEVTKGTLFHGLDKPKLVNFCHDTDEYEQNIIQEMQLYRIYNLLTSASHRVRLLQLSYVDSASGKQLFRRAAILLEEPSVMAARMGGPIIEQKGAIARDLDPFHDALAAVFQYMIGNTDFSMYALHNIEIVSPAFGDFIPVPYDFDFAGVINASYATVDPKLSVQHVRDRLFRGYCQPPEEYAKVFIRFNQQKDSIYALYRDSIGNMIKPGTVKETLKYYDEFYKTINDPKRAKREIVDGCINTN